jgi:hypothetical protein
MGFLARGFLRLHKSTSDDLSGRRRLSLLYSGSSTTSSKGTRALAGGNHSDYQLEVFIFPKGYPQTRLATFIIGAFSHGC